MKFIIKILIFLCFLFFLSDEAFLAPIPEKKYDIVGMIAEINWYPEKSIKGIERMSGSAGKDRIMPAHYIIKLINYEGINQDNASIISRYIQFDAIKNHGTKRVPFLIIKINHEDKNFLKKDMKIKVYGYTIRGDEGGTYTYYDRIEILNLK